MASNRLGFLLPCERRGSFHLNTQNTFAEKVCDTESMLLMSINQIPTETLVAPLSGFGRLEISIAIGSTLCAWALVAKKHTNKAKIVSNITIRAGDVIVPPSADIRLAFMKLSRTCEKFT
jgi:hypothetical protein